MCNFLRNDDHAVTLVVFNIKFVKSNATKSELRERTKCVSVASEIDFSQLCCGTIFFQIIDNMKRDPTNKNISLNPENLMYDEGALNCCKLA